MKRRAGSDELGRLESVMAPYSAPRGTGKALKEALRAHRPDPDLANAVRELREFIGPAQVRWRE
jgi:hypothetical protein